MKPALISAICGTTEKAAEKSVADAKGIPQALKRGYIVNDLTARLKSCPSRSHSRRDSSAASEIVPFPIKVLAGAANRDLFVEVLEQVRRRYHFVVVGYVVMPEHVHLLFSEPERGNPSVVMQAIKQGFARRRTKLVACSNWW